MRAEDLHVNAVLCERVYVCLCKAHLSVLFMVSNRQHSSLIAAKSLS